MSELFASVDLGPWRPLLTAIVLSPVPFLLLIVLGALALFRRARAGWLPLLLGVAGIWFGSTMVVGEALQSALVGSLTAVNPARLRSDIPTAIVVLGSGREAHAPEYGAPNLSPESLTRLRYGLWLARRSDLPVAFSGGIGHAQVEGASEALIATGIARDEFGLALRWTETRSRNTRENAAFSVALLRAQGIRRIVLVTHGWHMQRSLRAFEQAIARQGGDISLVAAPMALARGTSRSPLRWLPSMQGFVTTQLALRECIALLVGA